MAASIPNILVLGAAGMLGSAVFSVLAQDRRYRVFGTLRNAGNLKYFAKEERSRLIANVDVLNHDTLVSAFETVRPAVVINCVGLIKQLAASKDPLLALPINSLLPHRLAKLCALAGARLIQISTDCVFSGRSGMYKETDVSDAEDVYGKSKYMGELRDLPYAVTLRTSIIGHGISVNDSLIEWFLAQTSAIKGYEKAVFSGLPTIELARVIRDYVIPFPDLRGLYHISAEPIDKLSLLRLVAKTYNKEIDIIPDQQLCIDRSLDSTHFRLATGYTSPSWPELIRLMHDAWLMHKI